MAAGFVQVAPDSTGKKLQTFENTIGVDVVEAEAVVACNSDGTERHLLTDAELRATPVPVSGTFWQATQPVSGPLTNTELRAAAVPVDASGATVPVSGTFWQATQPVSISATLTTKETRSATGTTSQVADTASSTTLLASNANRLGASITNDSSARLYIKTGTTASATDYTVSLGQHDHWETPFGYTGRIDGIWATDPNDGGARVTEYT